jgi:hypothetical protein
MKVKPFQGEFNRYQSIRVVRPGQFDSVAFQTHDCLRAERQLDSVIAGYKLLDAGDDAIRR